MTTLATGKLCLLLIIFLLVDNGACIKWLALGRSWDENAWTKEACIEAKNLGLLERKQAKLCRTTLDVMPSFVQAAKDTSSVCQQAFRNRRWNCSSIDRAPDYSPELITGTREQAFVYAVSAAAAVWRLARGCALGSLTVCSCATPPRREPPSSSALVSSSYSPATFSFAISARNSFKWGGCGDDVRSASRMAKRFLQGTTIYQGSGPVGKFLQAVNMHNNRAGRRAVDQSLILECKCHGVSGSCSIRTCWRGLGSSGPSVAGARLLRRYATAAEVRPRVGGRLPPLYHHDNLLFTTKSSDYCLPDRKRGSLGTSGRQCNGSSSGYDGCEYLCCGRGHMKKSRDTVERCQCKYVSCCYVKCKSCRRITTTYVCN
ncbi:protein Wnt-11b-1-like [Leptopilina heterotoma]|uniref:protein Wnt-11b-1-like n=1 Tax=Leptopilina heterotoma TaxID=63436 RepID=UPI001CA7FB1F|nr:protein Wnt-11b-1-like [Leptopilina heterotoma]